MLEEAEIALARAELHVIEPEAAFLTSWRRSIDSRAAAKTHWKQSNHLDYSKHTYLLWSDTEFSFCVANAHPRPSSLGMTRPNRAAVIVNAKR
jgi:hypothetical protein